MHFCSERRQSRNARPVVALNLQQVNFSNNSYSYGDGGSRLRGELIGQEVPSSPPPPYEVYDTGRMQSDNTRTSRRRDSDSRRRRGERNQSVQHSSSQTPTPRYEAQISTNTSNDWRPPYSEDFITQSMNQSAALCDRVADMAIRLSDVFSTIDDGGAFPEEQPTTPESYHHPQPPATSTRSLHLPSSSSSPPKPRSSSSSSPLIDFSKSWLYANSRLPPYLPPLKLYVATWPIICAAAQASFDVYTRRPRPRPQPQNLPSSSSSSAAAAAASIEEDTYISADILQGTKAMTLHTQTVEVNSRRLIVLAIRGSKWNPVDWAVNFRPAPTAPTNFLDDEGNAAHAGFLGVARRMVGPVAERLRGVIDRGGGGGRGGAGRGGEEGEWSLVLTGHSAGGAVASLLYAHMLSREVRSELGELAGWFRRVHCVTFGAPPVTFLPLGKPEGRRFAKSVFLAFLNEGDPVVRADRKYVQNLVRLLAAPAPKEERGGTSSGGRRRRRATTTTRAAATWWEVPAATLSNAGKLVLLRERPGSRSRATEAAQISDEELRVHVFGDPAMHSMELYKSRVDALAVDAITGRRHD